MKHLIVLALLIAAFGLICAYTLHKQNQALQSIMCFTEHYVENSKHATPAQKKETITFYNKALANAHLAPCTTPAPNQGGR